MTEQEGTQEGSHVKGGLIQGVAGKNIRAGALDLRGVPPEQVARIESLKAGLVLVDEANREALAKVPALKAGSIVTAGPELRLLVQPILEISKGMLEAMPEAQQLLIVGNVFFNPDVSPAVVADKLQQVRIVGIVVACEGVHGALLGKADTTGISITLPNDVGPVVRSIGEGRLSSDYLSRLQDGTTYINIGETTVSADVSEDLLSQKIASYHNVGETVGPSNLLSLLKARCPTNLGEFSET
jgi:hypothetical protein